MLFLGGWIVLSIVVGWAYRSYERRIMEQELERIRKEIEAEVRTTR